MDIQKNKLGVLLFAFVAIIMAVVFIDVLGETIYLNRNLQQVLNETVTISATGTGQFAEDDVISIVKFANETNDFTPMVNTGINFTYAGVIATNFTAPMADTYNVTYTFEADEYIKGSSTARTLIGIILIFFALFIITIGINLFNKMREGNF